jgi:hypothetical protein
MTEPSVYAITVGGEWHSVEDDDGKFLDAIVPDEQCDSCGCGDAWELVHHMEPRYRCPGCDALRIPTLRDKTSVVFPT